MSLEIVAQMLNPYEFLFVLNFRLRWAYLIARLSMFPSNFLTDLARKYELSLEQEEVFLLWWVNGKDDREISEQLHVTAEAIRNRKTGIYKKFSIAGAGANKANKLRNWLDAAARKQDIKADIQPDADDLVDSQGIIDG